MHLRSMHLRSMHLVLTLATAAASYGPSECLTTLQNCDVCIAATGATWECGEETSDDRVPAELLKDPDLESEDLHALQAFLGTQMMAHWHDRKPRLMVEQVVLSDPVFELFLLSLEEE